MQACDEQVANPVVPCSSGPDIDVTGYVVDGSAGPVPVGPARVTILASNDGTPPRSLAYSYEINIEPPLVSSTTSTTNPTNSTVTSLTVTSTSMTSTTTLGPSACTVTFGLTNVVGVAGLTFDVDYAAAAGDFTGSDAAVSCAPNPGLGALGAFNDNDAARTMRIGLLAVSDFAGPADLATCDFVGLPAPVVGDFTVTLVESFAADLTAVPSVVAVTDLTCN